MKIQHNIPLHDKNWFATGGPARYFAEPKTANEFAQALSFARENNLSIFVLGQGANILISDEGYNGLVIRPQLNDAAVVYTNNDEVHITVGAGMSMHDLIEWCLDHHLIGMEEFSGIPGTIGGSVYINLHYYEFLLSHFFIQGSVIEKATGKIITVSHDWFHFGYNQSTLHDETYYLVSATLKVKKVSDLQTAFARGRRVEIIRHREKRYPAKNTCGSFFRNFHDTEVTLMSGNKKLIWVAYYLDKIGVKGALKIGDAIVSHQHANMLVNLGKATSTDIILLAKEMQQLVKNQFGIVPQPECRLIGFEKYPLL
jgi:UDP-N-acetylmuramate dehydrogenase